jgi:hypothetical protein
MGTSADCTLWLAQAKSIPFSHELDDTHDISIAPKILLHFLDALLECTVLTEELVHRLLHRLDLALGKSTAFQPDEVETCEVCSIALNSTKRNNIAFDTRSATDNCISTDPDKLVDRSDSPPVSIHIVFPKCRRFERGGAIVRDPEEPRHHVPLLVE